MPKRNISTEQKTVIKDELDQFMKRDRIEDFAEIHDKIPARIVPVSFVYQ